MITIETKNDKVELHIDSLTPHQEILLGTEMLIEILQKETQLDIDSILQDIKKIYERDNKKE